MKILERYDESIPFSADLAVGIRLARVDGWWSKRYAWVSTEMSFGLVSEPSHGFDLPTESRPWIAGTFWADPSLLPVLGGFPKCRLTGPAFDVPILLQRVEVNNFFLDFRLSAEFVSDGSRFGDPGSRIPDCFRPAIALS